MATFDQLAALRNAIAEPLSEDPWTDETLSTMLDANEGNVDRTASLVWTSKAANAAHLVDISEGGSSRKMSEVHKNALAMAAHYRALSMTGVLGLDGTVRARTRQIARD